MDKCSCCIKHCCNWPIVCQGRWQELTGIGTNLPLHQSSLTLLLITVGLAWFPQVRDLVHGPAVCVVAFFLKLSRRLHISRLLFTTCLGLSVTPALPTLCLLKALKIVGSNFKGKEISELTACGYEFVIPSPQVSKIYRFICLALSDSTF